MGNSYVLMLVCVCKNIVIMKRILQKFLSSVSVCSSMKYLGVCIMNGNFTLITPHWKSLYLIS